MYALNILEETRLINSKSDAHPCILIPNYYQIRGETILDPKQYRRLVEKLNYFTVTRPDIFFAMW